MNYHIEFVFEQLTDDQKKEIIGFWLAEKALTEEKAKERVSQVALLARDMNGKIVGISTIFKRLYEPIGKTFWVFRGFVSKDFRRHGVVLDLLKSAQSNFNERFNNDQDSDVIGMMLKVQNPNLMQGLYQAVTPRTGFVYVGMEDGCHMRICYFDNARID